MLCSVPYCVDSKIAHIVSSHCLFVSQIIACLLYGILVCRRVYCLMSFLCILSMSVDLRKLSQCPPLVIIAMNHTHRRNIHEVFRKMPKVKTRTVSKARVGVPYARGFQPPSRKRRLEAAAARPDEKLPAEYSNQDEDEFFPSIPRPSSIDDWLAQYNEEGQTYSKFLYECPWISKRKIKSMLSSFNPGGNTLTQRYPDCKIYLLPVGEFFSDHCAPAFSELAEYAQLFFTLPVVVLPAVSITVDHSRREVVWVESRLLREKLTDPKATRRSKRNPPTHIDARFHKNGHYQLQVGSVLLKLKHYIPPDGFCLMALTMSDLYDTKSDLFIAGMAAGNHRVGVFSLKRYDPTLTFATDNWFDVITSSMGSSADTRKSLMLQRSCKLLVHEIAHLLGVDHCIWYSCCMNGSGHLSEDFRQLMHLCPVDLRKLQTLIGFDVLERYQRLNEFFTKHCLKAEKEWTGKRIAFLTKMSI